MHFRKEQTFDKQILALFMYLSECPAWSSYFPGAITFYRISNARVEILRIEKYFEIWTDNP